MVNCDIVCERCVVLMTIPNTHWPPQLPWKTTSKRRWNDQEPGWGTGSRAIRTQPAALFSKLLSQSEAKCPSWWNATTASSLRPSIAHYFSAADDEEPQSCWHGTSTGTVGGLNVAALPLPIAAQTDASLIAYHYGNGNWGRSQCATSQSCIIKLKKTLFKVHGTKLETQSSRQIKNAAA